MTALTAFTHFLTFWPKGCNTVPSHGEFSPYVLRINGPVAGGPSLTSASGFSPMSAAPSPQRRGQPSVISRPASHY